MGQVADLRTTADESPFDLEVVIVAYGAFPLLRRCLLSLRENVAASMALRVHVVDNASPDGTADAVAREFPEVQLWRRPTNGGFASGTNVALRRTTAPYVLILNPDTEVPGGVLEHMLDVLREDPTAGMAGCRLELLDGSLDHAAKRSIPGPLQALGYFISRRNGGDHAYLAPQVDEFGFGPVEAINGAFMLVDATAVRVVGLLDEAYWMYGEDLDWCVRFAKAGYRIIYDGRVTALHVKGATSDRTRSPRLIWHFHKSMAIFYRAHQSRGNLVVDLAVYVGIGARFSWLSVKSVVLRLRRLPTMRKRTVRARANSDQALVTGSVSDAVHRGGLSVIILNWNSSADTRAAIEVLPVSWRRCIIVVDNGSDAQEREIEELRRIDGVTVIPRPDNGGYAAGMNTGMASALALGFTHAALVNADARPRAEDLEVMFALAADHAVVGTAQAGPKGGYVTAAVGRGVFPRAFDCRGCASGVHVVDVVSGATMVVDLAAVEAVGWMDESYFHYAEEVDLCLRLRQEGASIGWCCSTVVWHAVGGSLAHRSAGAHYYKSRNKVLLARRRGVRLWTSPRLVKDEATFAVLASRDGQLRAWGHGLRDGIRGVTGRWAT